MLPFFICNVGLKMIYCGHSKYLFINNFKQGKMDKIAKNAAETVINYFAEVVDRRFIAGKTYHRLIAADDDVFSAFIAADRYHFLRRQGQSPKVDCIGGFGLMSGQINPKRHGKKLSEAEMLRLVLIALGVRTEDIGIVCSSGTNTGANLAGYFCDLRESGGIDENLLFCLTKRLAGRFYLTQVFQQPMLKADYFWLETENECQLYNGKGFAGGLPYLSEAASIYDRYLRYADPIAGKPAYMKSLPHALSVEVNEAGEYLCGKYKLKIPEFSMLKIWQYILTYGYFLFHCRQCRLNLAENVYRWQDILSAKYAKERVLLKEELLCGLDTALRDIL